MPSCITHQLISEEALGNLPEEAKFAARSFPDYYFLGTQGPDVFFFYKPLSKKEFNLGRFLHRNEVYRVFALFSRQLKEANGVERERLAAYRAGYICHYCADVAFHPYVYRYLETQGADKSEHQLIESDWDVYFARERGKSAAGWEFPFSPKQIIADGTLFYLYTSVSKELGRIPPEKRNFDRGIALFARYLKFFRGKPLTKFWRGTEKVFGLAPVMSSLYPRRETDPAYLYGESFARLSGAESADELFQKAADETARLCHLFFYATDCGDPLPKEEFSKSFLTAQIVE